MDSVDFGKEPVAGKATTVNRKDFSHPKGLMLKIINEPYKLSYCRTCNKKRRVAKESHMCQECSAICASVACKLIGGR